MLNQYNHDMNAAIKIVRRDFGHTAKYARYAARKMRWSLGLPTVLLDLVNGYMDEFTCDAIWGIVNACKADPEKYKTVPYVIVMAVGTDNLGLYLELLEWPGLWNAPWAPDIWEFDFPVFSEFACLRYTAMCGKVRREFSFAQTIANMLQWLGRGGLGSKWFTKFVTHHADRRVSDAYATQREIPPESITSSKKIF